MTTSHLEKLHIYFTDLLKFVINNIFYHQQLTSVCNGLMMNMDFYMKAFTETDFF